MGESAKQLLGGFRLEEIVGLGAQGRVWRAVCVDASLGFVRKGDQVALKIKDAPDDDGEKWRDHEERVSLLKTMDHPNVVRYLGSFRVNDAGVDKHVIVQELLVGETLKARLKSLSLGLDVDEALRIVKAAATALEYTSGLGIHHRDIKPGNIFLCSDGGVKLIDFGVAKQGDGTVTESGNVRGTFDYLAPDFISPEFRGDERSDIFSLGVVLHEVVTSALPYVEDGKGELGYVSRWARHANSNETPIFVKPLARRVLRGVEDVLRKALAPEREKRYASFTEFRAGLDSVGFNDLKNGDRTYRWLKFIGKGGFGEVFKAKWLETGEAVAVKRLLNPTYAKRFHTEAKVMQQLQDPCFVSFVDFFVNGENAFLVMRFLDGMPGGSLRDAIDHSKRSVAHNGEPDSGGLPKPLVLSAFERYARGLSLLHRRKPSIIHRDIKPSNLYYPEGRPDLVAIMDFGIVREEDSSFTSGVPPCTFDYAPPEIATTTDKGSPGMDIFALGLCLYEALTGKTAYPRIPNGMPGLRMFIERCTSMRAPVFSDPRVQEDPELLDLLRRMTDPDVSKRITDAEEVAIALRRLFFRKATDDDCAPTMVFDNANAEAETRPIDEKQLMEWYRAWVEQHPGQSPFAAMPSDSTPAPRRKRTAVAMVLAVIMAAVGGAFLWPQMERLLNQGHFADDPFVKTEPNIPDVIQTPLPVTNVVVVTNDVLVSTPEPLVETNVVVVTNIVPSPLSPTDIIDPDVLNELNTLRKQSKKAQWLERFSNLLSKEPVKTRRERLVTAITDLNSSKAKELLMTNELSSCSNSWARANGSTVGIVSNATDALLTVDGVAIQPGKSHLFEFLDGKPGSREMRLFGYDAMKLPDDFEGKTVVALKENFSVSSVVVNFPKVGDEIVCWFDGKPIEGKVYLKPGNYRCVYQHDGYEDLTVSFTVRLGMESFVPPPGSWKPKPIMPPVKSNPPIPVITAAAKGFYEEADFRYENQDYGGAFENYYHAFKAGYPFSNGDRENIKDAFNERMTTLKNLINRIKAALEIGRTPPRDLKGTEEERSGLIEKYREMRIHLK